MQCSLVVLLLFSKDGPVYFLSLGFDLFSGRDNTVTDLAAALDDCRLFQTSVSRWSHNQSIVKFMNPQTSCLQFYRRSFQCTYVQSVSSVELFQSPPSEPDYTCCSMWTHQPPRDMTDCNLCIGLLPPLFTLIGGWSSPLEVSVSVWWMTRCSGLLSWPHFQKPCACMGVAEHSRWQWKI